MNVSNKNIIVTGAGSGMGREISLLLLKQNANVIGIDLNLETLKETRDLAGVDDSRFLPIQLNITDQAKISQLPDQLAQKFGAIDGLINNAGIIQPFKHVKDLSLEEIKRTMDVNFYGTVYLTIAFLPHLLTRPDAHIVNISSMGGFLPVPGQTIYGASKAAVKLFTEGLYSELMDTNVHVTVVFPGAINTNITKNSGIESPSASSAEESSMKALDADKAAEIIVKGMEGNKFRVTVGKDAGFLDKFSRLLPKRAVHFIQKKMSELIN